MKKEKGHLWWHYWWASICSMHCEYNPQCSMCATGHWVHTWSWRANRFWYWWLKQPERLKNWMNFTKP